MGAWKEEVVRGAMYTLGALTTLTAVGVAMSFFGNRAISAPVRTATSGAFGVPPFAAGAFPVHATGATAIERPRAANWNAPRMSAWGAW